MYVNYTAPSSIAPGGVGTINITSVIFEGDIIKVTSTNGVSTSKPAPLEWYGAVAYWKFDETTGTTAYDSIENNDGNLTNGPLWTSGKYENGIMFDGMDDYVNVGNVVSLKPTDAVSISAWINYKGHPPANTLDGIIGYNDGSNFGYQIRYFGVWQFVLRNGSTTISANGGTITANEWHHLVGTYNRTHANFYVDSILKQTSLLIAPIVYPSTSLFIGKVGSWTSYFNGTIDEVAIWNRSLSDQEVAKLYSKEIY
jgi:hypothetical protein